MDDIAAEPQRIDGRDRGDYIWARLETAANDATEAKRHMAVHEAECASRYGQLSRDVSEIRFWLKLGTVSVGVLFLSVFLHLDLLSIIKLLSPAVTIP